MPPDRWCTGLQVALQKEPGNFNVVRLRFIQIYEADFNDLDKYIFRQRVMQILLKAGEIPEEHYAQKESTAEDANMDKTLTFDLSRISKTPMTNVSVDAENCFDRISHVILMLIWYAITQDWMLVTMFLEVIGRMRLFQRTGFGDSQTFVGGPDIPRPFQGKGQGSGGAPAAWIHHSTMENIFDKASLRPFLILFLEKFLARWVGFLWTTQISTLPWIPNAQTRFTRMKSFLILTSWILFSYTRYS